MPIEVSFEAESHEIFHHPRCVSQSNQLDCSGDTWVKLISRRQTNWHDHSILAAYFIEKCYRDDPEVDECLQFSGNKLASFLHQGIPELGLEEVEPTVIDEISIALGDGPDAYRATFTNIEAYGVSNISLARVRSDIDTYQFQLTYEIPRIKVRSNFKSTGVLWVLTN